MKNILELLLIWKGYHNNNTNLLRTRHTFKKAYRRTVKENYFEHFYKNVKNYLYWRLQALGLQLY